MRAPWILGLGLALLAAAAGGEERITERNVDTVKALVSPGLEWCIRRGFPLTIADPKPIVWPQACRDATEKYAAQVRLGADGLTLENYVAGVPFPTLDPADPRLAVKIMWNYEHNRFNGDDLDVRNFDADTGSIADHGPMSVERHFLVDHFRRLYWTGLYSDLYDRAGELWKVAINDVTVRRKLEGTADAIEYPDAMAFIPGFVMIDMQLEHGTKVSLPSHRFPGEQGWYFNQGEKAGGTDD